MQIILVIETRASCESDYRYIKSAIDYFYVERSFKISKVFARTKSELINCDKKIKEYKNRYSGITNVLICADYDRDDDPNNEAISDYCAAHGYDLVWMNIDVEDVFLGKIVPDKEKSRESFNFLKRKDALLSSNKALNIPFPLVKRPASNLLVVLDRYLKRKT